MAKYDDAAITQAVIDRFAETPNPRLKVLLNGLTRHLHAFVRETEPTFDEWLYAIKYLTAVGHKSEGPRQEFILLSDVMGVSMLVDAGPSRSMKTSTEVSLVARERRADRAMASSLAPIVRCATPPRRRRFHWPCPP